MHWSEAERAQSLGVRALWGRPLEGMAREAGAARAPAFDEGLLRLPAQAPARLYAATLHHVAAHRRYSTLKFARGSLRPMQMAVAGLIEDARVEQLALEEYPGLRRLWLPFHADTPQHSMNAPALFARLARALLDETHEDLNPFVAKARRMFQAARDRWQDPLISRELGNLLGNDLGQMRVQFDHREWRIEPAYRDDNQHLWEAPETPPQRSPFEDAQTLETGVSMMQGAGEEAPDFEVPELSARIVGADPQEDTRPEGPAFQYGEWDRLIRVERPAWCTVREIPRAPGAGGAAATRLAGDLQQHAATLARMSTLIDALALERPRRLRRQPEGEALDLDACIEAAVQWRSGVTPDDRVQQRLDRRQRDVSTLLLLDLSESTRDPVPGTGRSVLETGQLASALMLQALQRLGDACALHGFASNGRDDVRYQRLVDFGEVWSPAVLSRVAAAQPGYSTRMGAALRHAGSHLRPRRATHRIVLLVTDGAPHDIDIHDPRYLVEDTRHAVRSLRAEGMATFCLSLDPRARAYADDAFGPRNHQILPRVSRLPEVLLSLYLRLTG